MASDKEQYCLNTENGCKNPESLISNTNPAELTSLQYLITHPEHVALFLTLLSFIIMAVNKYLNHRFKIDEDIDFIKSFFPITYHLQHNTEKNKKTFSRQFDKAVRKFGDKEAIYFVDEDRSVSFREIDIMANRMANYMTSKFGLRKGDVISIFMMNRPEYVMLELACAKIGVTCALINFNLKGKALIHSIKLSESKLIVFANDGNIVENLSQVQSDIDSDNKSLQYLCYGSDVSDDIQNVIRMDTEELLKRTPTECPEDPNVSQNDTFQLVFTSGTTGMPKAAVIPHRRTFLVSKGFGGRFKIKPDDRVYCTLPLYHSSGGTISVGFMINFGTTLILRSKFSVRNFWKDAGDTNATVVQYIGELCRYLLQPPPSEYDKAHKVRLAYGNGLRPDVWQPFCERFGLKEIGEFYGATEGNVVFFNHWKHGEPIGAIGKAGPLNRATLRWTIVKFDVENEIPIRNSKGNCIKCKPGETGELIAEITSDTQYDGYYKNKQASDGKILRNVFKKGDKYFRSGDLIMADNQSYIFFVDRIGDTFRWKGENVSTTEVAQSLSSHENIEEINVVGCEIPGKDGRACMIAVVPQNCSKTGSDFDFEALRVLSRDHLPAYAHPLFIRILPQIEMTGTFKQMKSKYKTEGIDLDKVKDPIYFLNNGKYERFTRELYNDLITGKMKV